MSDIEDQGSFRASRSIPSELVKRLSAATVGSRELDAAVAGIFVHDIESDDGDFWWGPFGQQAERIPDLTTSLDAALALAERVLPGPVNYIEIRPADGSSRVEIGWPAVSGVAATPALALCMTILKAIQGKA